jgi:hypothetical protein
MMTCTYFTTLWPSSVPVSSLISRALGTLTGVGSLRAEPVCHKRLAPHSLAAKEHSFIKQLLKCIDWIPMILTATSRPNASPKLVDDTVNRNAETFGLMLWTSRR